METNFSKVTKKQAVFIAAMLAVAGFIGWSFKFINFSADINIYGAIIWFLAVGIFIILLSLFILAEKNRAIDFFVTAAVSLLFFIFTSFKSEYLWGILGSMLFLSWGIFVMRREAEARLRYSWFAILPKGMKKFFTALALAAAIIHFANFNPDRKVSDILMPRAFFDGVISVIESPMGKFFPGFRAADTTDEIIMAYLARQGAEQFNIKNIPKNILQPIVASQRQALASRFGLKLSGKEKISDVIYQASANTINIYTSSYKEHLPTALTIGYFITIKFFLFLLGFALMILFPLAVKFFVGIGIIKKDSIMVDKEILRISPTD